MKPKLGIIDKFRPLWEGGKSVEKYNIKVGFKIRMYVVSQITSQRQKNPNLLNQKDIEQLSNMIIELKQDKSTIPPEEQTCSLEDYQKFLFDFFSKVDYEDRHETVTIKTTSKFRLMASFIDVLSTWGPIDEEMIKCKKYCQFKAVDIFKALKRGEIPKRGGPKEQIDENNNENKNNNINVDKNDIKLAELNNKKQNKLMGSVPNNNHNMKNNNNPDKINNNKNSNKNNNINKDIKNNNQKQKNIKSDSINNANNHIKSINNNKTNNNDANLNYDDNNYEIIKDNNFKKENEKNYSKINKTKNNLNLNIKNNDFSNDKNKLNYKGKVINTNPNINNQTQIQKDPRIQRKINIEQKNNLLNKTEYKEIKNNFQNHPNQIYDNKLYFNKKTFDINNQNVNQQLKNTQNLTKTHTLNMNNNTNKLRNNNTNINPNINNKNNYNMNTNLNTNYKRKSLVVPSNDGNTKKRTFKGKYKLTTYIPVKYNTVPYFMLVENVRINNDNAKKALKRDKAANVLNLVLDSLDFLSYIHK